jgi:hypothetical protein
MIVDGTESVLDSDDTIEIAVDAVGDEDVVIGDAEEEVLSTGLELEAGSLCEDACEVDDGGFSELDVVASDGVARMTSTEKGEDDDNDELELAEPVGATSETSKDKRVDNILCC